MTEPNEAPQCSLAYITKPHYRRHNDKFIWVSGHDSACEEPATRTVGDKPYCDFHAERIKKT